MKEKEAVVGEKRKTVRQALKELIAGYDVLGNLKFLVIAFFWVIWNQEQVYR